MAPPFPGVRNSIISGQCYRQLDRFRAFCHYGTNLDFDIVVERSHEAVATFNVFRGEVRSFFANLLPEDGRSAEVPEEPHDAC
jgi:hypothetical protein